MSQNQYTVLASEHLAHQTLTTVTKEEQTQKVKVGKPINIAKQHYGEGNCACS